MPRPGNNPDWDPPPKSRREWVFQRTPAGYQLRSRRVPAGDEDFSGPTVDVTPALGDFGRTARKYVWLVLAAALLGGALGVGSVVFIEPVYRARTLLEVQRFNENFMVMQALAPESADQVNIQTQIRILTSSTLIRKILERLQMEALPPVPAQADFFSRLRRRFRPGSQDPLLQLREGLQLAARSFDARPVNGTRLIEITSESTNPDLAANFISAAAADYIDETLNSRSSMAQKTGQWLTGQLEEVKTKLRQAEGQLQAYVRQSGNMFVAHDNTLADSKLRQLQTELSAIQADRIAKQARYEMAKKTAADALPDVLDDPNLRAYQSRLVELRREYAALTATLTTTNPKVQKVQAQITEVEKALSKEVSSVETRIKNDYETALNREQLLSRAYHAQAGQVSSQGERAAEYDSLKREVETLRNSYASILQQSNQANLSYSIPVSNIRVVEPARASDQPVRPSPPINIGLGTLLGLFSAVGFVFLRERMDQSVRQPGSATAQLNVPELGVIPSLAAGDGRWRGLVSKMLPAPSANGVPLLTSGSTGGNLDRVNPTNLHFSESFRSVVTSLLRQVSADEAAQVILITSPEPEDGKTTFASNLALAMSDTGKSVLLVDGDFRRPRLHRRFGLSNHHGLSQLLEDEAVLPEQLGLATEYPGLHLLPNGPPVVNLTRVLHSPNLRMVLRQARQSYSVVIVDAPPLQFADARVLSPFVDGVVLVIRAGTTAMSKAQEACQCLRDDGVRVFGTVLNDWIPSRATKRSYSRYYDRDREAD